VATRELRTLLIASRQKVALWAHDGWALYPVEAWYDPARREFRLRLAGSPLEYSGDFLNGNEFLAHQPPRQFWLFQEKRLAAQALLDYLTKFDQRLQERIAEVQTLAQSA